MLNHQLVESYPTSNLNHKVSPLFELFRLNYQETNA